MTTNLTELTANYGPNAVAELIHAGSAIAGAERHDIGDLLALTAVVPEGYNIVEHVIDNEHLLANPRRKSGTPTARDAASFIAYLAKHAEPSTEVWADLDRSRLVAVIDAHGDLPGWGQHRLSLQLQHTPGWVAWVALDRKMQTQLDFASHVEDRIIDFVDPAGAVMLELAQSFQATSKGKFESSKRLKGGETTVEWREEVDAKAGEKGELVIPDAFTVALVPFKGGSGYRVTTRLRYRISEGSLRLGYILDRPEDVLQTAFEETVEAIAGAIEAPVFIGAPA